jgi:hypothetical protein
MNSNPFAAGSGIDFTFGGALNNLPEGVDRSKAFEMLMNDALANKRSKENTAELRELLEYAGSPERQQRILDMTRDFQNKQMAEAGKYKALFGLPKQIMNAFTIPAAIAATGDIAAANTLATAGANMGSLYTKIQPMQVGIPTVNYGFSS